MGAPSRGRRKARRRGISRRAFLRGAGGSALALSAAALAGCSAGGGGGGDGEGVNPFQHGTATGDPLPEAIIFWTRATPLANESIPVTLKVYADPQLKQKIGETRQTASADRDWTIKIDYTGLSPSTSYYYQFEARGFKSAIGRTRTAPAANAVIDRLRFGVVSCASLAHGLFNVYGALAARADLDAILHLGDYIYEYGSGEYGNAREYQPANEIATLSDYRTRHAQYKQDVNLQALHRQNPFITVWDDHESANDSYKDGAENHQGNEDEPDWFLRKANAQKAYDEWMPIRLPTPGDTNRIFRELAYGNLVDLVMLDTRLYARSLQCDLQAQLSCPDDTTRSLAGAEQLAWLESRLKTSAAKWKLIGQQVMFGQLKVAGTPELIAAGGVYLNMDQWDGYRADRDRVFDMLDTNAIRNAVVLTGDIHSSWAMDLSRDPNNLLVYRPGLGPIETSGSLAVEFVAPSVTSPGLDQLAPIQDVIRLLNPHMKYVDLSQHGYVLLDVTPQRCQGEWWYVDTIDSASQTEAFAAAWQAADGKNYLSAGTQSTPRSDAPAMAG
ncbi:MAG: twin-arginine translocation signal protein [Hydrocarboniphaga sp.]|uniref:alkaline phosphatase D family protein n=1 Tax=Hydrocarboniphaga sp. TaxID=2033016 RepID=UPI0026388AE4|nr:alkaline phosphatase D family protein [Hydrocarboniphaga sp.]MDB5969137.1 twin-arginine translocation signal protein [Hydrocarboniphaga sp.]